MAHAKNIFFTKNNTMIMLWSKSSSDTSRANGGGVTYSANQIHRHIISLVQVKFQVGLKSEV